jgi:hypothetical protein
MTECPGRVRRSGPVRLLAAPDLEPQAPVAERLPTEARQYAGQARKGGPGRLRQQVLADKLRTDQFDRQRHEVAERPDRAPGGGALQPGARHPERQADLVGQEPLEGLAGPGGEDVRDDLDTAVGVDPPTAGTAEDRVTVESEPGRVRQQVPDRRSRRSGRLVQIEQAALHAVERGQRDEQLGHRRPAIRPLGRPGRFHQARRRRDAGRGGGRPRRHLIERIRHCSVFPPGTLVPCLDYRLGGC